MIALASMAGGAIPFGGFLVLARSVCGVIAIYDLCKIWGIVRRHKRVTFCECTLSEFGCSGGHFIVGEGFQPSLNIVPADEKIDKTAAKV